MTFANHCREEEKPFGDPFEDSCVVRLEVIAFLRAKREPVSVVVVDNYTDSPKDVRHLIKKDGHPLDARFVLTQIKRSNTAEKKCHMII